MLINEIKSIPAKSTKPELRKFGITIGIFLGLLAGYLFWKQYDSAVNFAIAGGAMLTIGLILPILLKPIYIGWMSFAVVMGFFMTRVILTLIYGICFVPAGLVIQVLGKDPLREKIEPHKESYWIKREKKVFDPKTAENQF